MLVVVSGGNLVPKKRLIIFALIAIALASTFSGTDAAEIAQASTVKPIVSNVTIPTHVAAYFSDVPIMVEIARCESHMRHYGTDGEVIRGEIDRGDIGVMQINERYHRKTAEKFNLDIDTLEDNMVYARKLYEREGTKPWISSMKCWGKHVAVAST